MEIKTTMSYQQTPSRRAKIQTELQFLTLVRMWGTVKLNILLVGMYHLTTLEKHQYLAASFTGEPLPYDPAIPLLSIYPRQMETYVHTQT